MVPGEITLTAAKSVKANVLLFIIVFIAILIMFTHRSNIQRLLRGEENRVSFKKSKENDSKNTDQSK